MTVQTVTTKSLFQYGFIALPVAFAGFPLYVLAPDFYATRHGVSLTLLGTLLLGIRLLDAVQDPFIGWVADSLKNRYLALMSGAGILLCLSIAGLFNALLFSPALWFTICMVAAISAFSVLTIVLGAQATLWTADKAAQTRIAGAREAFGLVGLIIAVSMPSVLSKMVPPDSVYLWYSAILAGLVTVGLACFAGLPALEASKGKVSRSKDVSPWRALRAVPIESRRLFAVYALSMLASSIPAVLVIFFVRDLLGAENLTGLFLLLYFLSGAVAMPIWKYVSGCVGKYSAWGLSKILAVSGFVGAYFLGSGDIVPYAAVCVASGLALGADLSLPPSILADHIHARENSAHAGTHYAFLAFVGKVSLALASAIALPVLDAAGFIPQAENSKQALSTLSAAYALIPCLLKLLAAVLLYFFFIRSHTGGNNENLENHGSDRSTRHA